MSTPIRKVISPAARFALDEYRLMKQIGQGGCGKVYLAKNKLTSEKCAIKRVTTDNARADKYLAEEINTMKAVKKIPGVIQYIDSFKKQDTTNIVMEHINGWNLQSIVENLELDERMIASLTCKIL